MKKVTLKTIFIVMLILVEFNALKAEKLDISGFDKDEIAKLWKDANQPKILVISGHTFDGGYSDERIIDAGINRINEYLQKLGIPYVSYNSTQDLMGRYGGFQSYEEIAMKANTQFYIKVNLVKSELGKKTKDAYFSSVTITLDAFDTENGMGIGSTSNSSGIIGSVISQQEANFESARTAGSKGAVDIITQIIENVKNVNDKGTSYEITLEGVSDYTFAKDFKDCLTGLPEFTGEIRVSYNGHIYRYEVWYKNKRPDMIADAIMECALKKNTLRKLDMCGDPGKLIAFCIKQGK